MDMQRALNVFNESVNLKEVSELELDSPYEVVGLKTTQGRFDKARISVLAALKGDDCEFDVFLPKRCAGGMSEDLTHATSDSSQCRLIYLGCDYHDIRIEPDFEFTYKADGNQMAFLQLLSSKAYQKLIYHCKNSVAVFDTKNRTFKNSIRIMTISDTQLNARGNKKYRYNVLDDGCKSGSNSWSSTSLVYHTDKPQRLPFTDVGLRDIGKPNQSFKIEVGPVCFA